jgi:hypothetical protein
MQQRAVTMVSGLKGKTYEERLVELGLATPEECRHQMDMLQTFKIIKGHDRVHSTMFGGHLHQNN